MTMTTIYCSSTGAPNATGVDPTTATSLPSAVARLRSGTDAIVRLFDGNKFPSFQLPSRYQGNLSFSAFPGDPANPPVIDGKTAILGILLGGSLELSGIALRDSNRDPSRPQFSPSQGGYGVYIADSPNLHLHIHNCSFDWFALHCAVQSMQSPQHATIIESNRFGPCYGINQRSQAIYAEGQFDAIVQDNSFYHAGWWPTIAPAINQNHAIYWHSGDAKACGPLMALRNLFYLCAASGPTSNAGGVFRDNLIVDCAQDGSTLAAWGSSDYFEFVNNMVIGGFVNVIARNAFIADNRFISPGSLSVNVDIPAKTIGWRTPANVITLRRNIAFASTGPVIRLNNYLPAVINDDGTNFVFPAPTNYGDVIRASVRKQLGLAV